jgi:Spy/CpxP family protein refolding chaperone
MRAIRFITAAALVLVASTAATAAAQGGQGQGMTPEQRQARQNEMLFKDITLTEVQKARIDTIQVKAREANTALMQGGGMGDPATREKMMAARTKTMADIRAVLTAEQATVFDKNLAAMPQRGGGQRPPN